MSTATATTARPEIQIARSLDCQGLLCPMPIYKTSMALKQLAPGEVLEIVCTDPGSLKDFPALARQGHHELLSAEERGGTQVFLLRKGGAG